MQSLHCSADRISNNITDNLLWAWVPLCRGDEGRTWITGGVVLTGQQAALLRDDRDFQIVYYVFIL